MKNEQLLLVGRGGECSFPMAGKNSVHNFVSGLPLDGVADA